MSIWASYGSIGWEPESQQSSDGVHWHTVPGHMDRGTVIAYRQGWSNHYPDGDPGATVGVASIPAWCVPGHKDADESDECDDVGPWLRLDIDSPDAKAYGAGGREQLAPVHGSAVLDEAAVRALRDGLTAWLDRGKVYPK